MRFVLEARNHGAVSGWTWYARSSWDSSTRRSTRTSTETVSREALEAWHGNG